MSAALRHLWSYHGYGGRNGTDMLPINQTIKPCMPDIERASDEKLNIAYVITRSDVIGGAQVHVRDLAGRLLADGHEVTVVVGGQGPLTSDFDRLRIPWVSIPSLVQPLHPANDLAALCQIAQNLRRLKPDLVSAHTSKAGVLARLACHYLQIPVVFTAHGWSINPDRYSGAQLCLFRFIERFAGRNSNQIINVCIHERDLALKNEIASVERLSVIHNGMPDVPSQLIANPDTQPPRIIMVARMDQQKDHETLMRAIVQMRHFDWQLDLIGDGPLASSVRQLVRDLSLIERVRFLGDAGWRVAEHLAEAQIFVLASKWEAFPRCILEAMRAGLPVVATDVSGVREAVNHGTTGFLVPRQDADALRDCLHTLITRPHLRAKMGAAARGRYLSQFTFEEMYEQTLALYREVVGRRTSGHHPFRLIRHMSQNL